MRRALKGTGGSDFRSVLNEGLARKRTASGSMSAGALIGMLSGVRTDAADVDDNGINDVFDEVIEKEKAMKAAGALNGDGDSEESLSIFDRV